MFFKVFCFLSFLTSSFLHLNGQGLNDTKARIDKGNEIIKTARKVIYKGIKPEEVKGLYLKKEINLTTGKPNPKGNFKALHRQVMDKEVSINFPFQIKLLLIMPNPSIEDDDEQEILRTAIVANGDKVSIQTVSIFDGDVITQDEALLTSGLSKKDIEKIRKHRKNLETKEHAQNEVYTDVMPLLLREWGWDKEGGKNSKYLGEKDYKYLGKAKVGKRLTDVLEIVQPEKIKEHGFIKLFFDEKSKLLLMMLLEIKVQNGTSQAKYYFSDYQEMDGLLVAKKINTEAIVTKKDGSKQRTIQKITVKDFKINPVFKAGTFAVKK